MSLSFEIILSGMSDIDDSPLNSNIAQSLLIRLLHNLTLIAHGLLMHHCGERSCQGAVQRYIFRQIEKYSLAKKLNCFLW